LRENKRSLERELNEHAHALAEANERIASLPLLEAETIRKAQVQGDAIINEANAKARAIVADAKVEAEKIVDAGSAEVAREHVHRFISEALSAAKLPPR
jgi:cell division septum initiation protein DivIVA